MRCDEMMEHLELLSPSDFAESWDNVGLLAGRREKEIRKVFIALDATERVIDEAVRVGADLLLTHHPLVFSPVKKINTDDFIGRRLVKLLQNDINYYVMHTNFDVMGMADAAADEIGLKNRKVLQVTYEDDIANEGIGRYGKLPVIMTLEECALYVKRKFGLQSVNMYGDGDADIEYAAICPGSGKRMISYALEAGVQVLITGDIGHHEGLDAVEQGLCIVDAGHYGLEQIFVPYMREYIERELPDLEVFAAKEQCPFQTLT